MALDFYVDDCDRLVMEYFPEWGGDSISNLIRIIKSKSKHKGYLFKHTYFLLKDKLIISDNENGQNVDSVSFCIGHSMDDGYIYLDKEVFGIEYEFAFSNSFKLYSKYLSKNNVSLIKLLSKTVRCNLFIDNNRDTTLKSGHISIKDYKELINKIPTKRELELYTYFSIENIVEQFVDKMPNYKDAYEKYVSKRRKDRVYNERYSSEYYQYKVEEYSGLLNELKNMLKNDAISEIQWQSKIMDLIRIIYPNYIYIIPQFEFTSLNKTKKPDFVAIDSDGNVDVIEIKKANIGSLLKLYRDNYVPKSELSGAIVQVEQYTYLMKSNKEKVENVLETKYKNYIGNMKINVINPRGIIIAGRSDTMNKNERNDFEVIKRMHKNISEIITYDDLLNRFQNSIDSFVNKTSSD